MDSEVKYGYITGEFEIDPSIDHVVSQYRIDSKGKRFDFMSIETTRDMTGKNVKIIGNSREFRDWRLKYMPKEPNN